MKLPLKSHISSQIYFLYKSIKTFLAQIQVEVEETANGKSNSYQSWSGASTLKLQIILATGSKLIWANWKPDKLQDELSRKCSSCLSRESLKCFELVKDYVLSYFSPSALISMLNNFFSTSVPYFYCESLFRWTLATFTKYYRNKYLLIKQENIFSLSKIVFNSSL